MALRKMQRDALEDEARELYEKYQTRKTGIERRIREEVRARVIAEQGDALRELSRALHEYHREGLSKAAIRRATKKYGNNDEFLKIWNAYDPGDEFEVAAGRPSEPTFDWREGVLYVRKNPTTKEALAHELALPFYNRQTVYLGLRGLDPAVDDLFGGIRNAAKAMQEVKAEIERAFEEGEIVESTHPYDYVNDLPEDERDDYLNRAEEKLIELNDWSVA